MLLFFVIFSLFFVAPSSDIFSSNFVAGCDDGGGQVLFCVIVSYLVAPWCDVFSSDILAQCYYFL